MGRIRFTEMLMPLLGAIMFLFLAVKNYLGQNGPALYVYILAVIWFIIDLVLRVSENDSVQKVLRIVRHIVFAFVLIVAGYIFWTLPGGNGSVTS